MNKKYMDFVPAKSNKRAMSRDDKTKSKARPELVYPVSQSRKVVATSGVGSVQKKPSVGTRRVGASSAAMSVPARKSPSVKRAGTPVLGVVEDLNSRFVENDLPKRPLGNPERTKGDKKESKSAKMRMFDRKKASRSVEKPVEKNGILGDKKTFVPPKSPFINMEKVTKRPLSRNVYQKKVEPPKEEPKGPVTIISKPEKEAHVSLVVVVILTIILGAAAGTVAFLLLPK